MNRQIQFGSIQIDFILRIEDRKSIFIQVYPDTSIIVCAPKHSTEEAILRKVRLKAPWIIKQIAFFGSFQPLTKPRRFISGETHLYLGRQHRLKITPGTPEDIKVFRGQIWIYSQTTSASILKDRLDDWYRKRALIIFHELLSELFPKFKRYRINCPVLIIRKMSKRWGSCTTGGKIILNTELIKAPKSCIEYVLTHELCHLVHSNHSKYFFQLLNRILPDWERRKDQLERLLA